MMAAYVCSWCLIDSFDLSAASVWFLHLFNLSLQQLCCLMRCIYLDLCHNFYHFSILNISVFKFFCVSPLTFHFSPPSCLFCPRAVCVCGLRNSCVCLCTSWKREVCLRWPEQFKLSWIWPLRSRLRPPAPPRPIPALPPPSLCETDARTDQWTDESQGSSSYSREKS